MRRKQPLDPIDRRLLRLLQADALAGSRALADALGVSASSVQRRILALRQRKVIEGMRVVVNAAEAGRPLLVIVNVVCEREDTRTVLALKRQFKLMPEVLEAFHVTGEATFILILCLRDMDEFKLIAERLCADPAVVRRIYTNVVIDPVTRASVVPIDDPPG
jgi:DNA-binding Lrp family transcriptional regulator